MTYGEAWRVLSVLGRDPSSWVAASLSGWQTPVTQESAVLMDLFDLQHASKSKHKPKPYPRPWPDRTKTRTAPAAHLTQDEIIAALRAAGHTAPIPMRRAT
jgi:hypothetical protein